MHISGDILFSSGNKHYKGSILVADVFNDSNEIRTMMTIVMNPFDDLPKDLNEIDTVCFQTLLLDYSFLVISKDITLDIDYNEEQSGIIRMFMNIDYVNHNTNVVLCDGTMIDESDPICKEDVDFYVKAFNANEEEIL